ncbi:conserved hypothetical protein [Frankia canadensis]|uniref:Uncharacterized protein n=1 Tax=Frankia canadensis TaxID=1836972 RepID=A0A2I2KVP4_9ACTN|nr:conserved hypothetical protein [Frankia canadensis]SOU57027.1 conserved hypothetical protein [Frankia canadensis]
MNHEAFFVSFGGTGRVPRQMRHIDVRSLCNCARLTAYAVEALADGKSAAEVG